jgi:chromosome segregation ATPase
MSSTSTSSLSVDPIVSDLVRKNTMLNNELNEVKEVSNLNQSTLQVLARDLEIKDQECTVLRQSVHTLKADFEMLQKGRDDELAILQAQLRELTVHRDAPKLERDHHSEQLVLLQQENKILANRATIAENTISKYMACVNTLKQQYQSLCTFLNQEQQAGEE